MQEQAELRYRHLLRQTEFYRKFGYDYKNGAKELDDEHHCRLEKFKEAGLK